MPVLHIFASVTPDTNKLSVKYLEVSYVHNPNIFLIVISWMDWNSALSPTSVSLIPIIQFLEGYVLDKSLMLKSFNAALHFCYINITLFRIR